MEKENNWKGRNEDGRRMMEQKTKMEQKNIWRNVMRMKKKKKRKIWK